MIYLRRNKSAESFRRIFIALISVVLLQGCANLSQKKSTAIQTPVSLKNIYDHLLTTKLDMFNEVEINVGKLSIYKQETNYSSYSGSSFDTQDGYALHASDVRVRAKNINDIIMVKLQIDSKKCLKISSVALEYGPDAIRISDIPTHLSTPSTGVAYYSTIVNDWGYVNFGFDQKACLNEMSFFKGKLWKGKAF